LLALSLGVAEVTGGKFTPMVSLGREIMHHVFGLLDLVVACAVLLAAIITFLVEIPELIRYMKIRSM
jgi:hypothetical protein